MKNKKIKITYNLFIYTDQKYPGSPLLCNMCSSFSRHIKVRQNQAPPDRFRPCKCNQLVLSIWLIRMSIYCAH